MSEDLRLAYVANGNRDEIAAAYIDSARHRRFAAAVTGPQLSEIEASRWVATSSALDTAWSWHQDLVLGATREFLAEHGRSPVRHNGSALRIATAPSYPGEQQLARELTYVREAKYGIVVCYTRGAQGSAAAAHHG